MSKASTHFYSGCRRLAEVGEANTWPKIHSEYQALSKTVSSNLQASFREETRYWNSFPFSTQHKCSVSKKQSKTVLDFMTQRISCLLKVFQCCSDILSLQRVLSTKTETVSLKHHISLLIQNKSNLGLSPRKWKSTPDASCLYAAQRWQGRKGWGHCTDVE